MNKLLLGLTASALATPLLADSPASWEAWRAEVEAACLALVADFRGQPAIEVSPFGSESYGAAIIDLVTNVETDRAVCIFDKHTRQAELTAPWPITLWAEEESEGEG